MTKNTNKKGNVNVNEEVRVSRLGTVIIEDSCGNAVDLSTVVDSLGKYEAVYPKGWYEAERSSVPSEGTEDDADAIILKSYLNKILRVAQDYVPAAIKTPEPEMFQYGTATSLELMEERVQETALEMAAGHISPEDATETIKRCSEEISAAKNCIKDYEGDRVIYEKYVTAVNKVNAEYIDSVTNTIKVISDSYNSYSKEFDIRGAIDAAKGIKNPNIRSVIINTITDLDVKLAERRAMKRAVSSRLEKLSEGSIVATQATLGVAGSLAIGVRLVKGGISIAKKLAKLNQLLK